jgi:hypothetical protein
MNMHTREKELSVGTSPEWWMLATLLGSVLALGILIILTSGDVPRADEWNTPGDYLLAKARGTATFADLFRQHNESRVIFAQLLTAFLSRFWGWNQHVLHAINLMLLTLTAFLFTKIAVRSWPSDQGLSRPVVLILCSAVCLTFTPVQWRNILSSGQIITIAIPCLLVAGTYLNLKDSLPIWFRYLSAAIFSLIASFCFVNGLLLWFLLWPAPFSMLRRASFRLSRSELLATAMHFGAALTVIAAFFSGYHKPPGHPSLGTGFSAPHRTLFFALTWLAGPILPEQVLHWAAERDFVAIIVCGGLSGLVGLLLALYLVKNRRAFISWDLAARIFPFVVLLAYSLVSAASISLARAGLALFGNVSRYSTVALPAYLGLAGIVANVSLAKGAVVSRTVLRGLATTFALAVVVGAGTGVYSSFVDKAASKQAKLSLAIRKLSPRDPLLTKVYPSAEYVSKLADKLEAFGILRELPSYSWLGGAPPAQRADATCWIEMRDSHGQKAITGALSPTNIAESDDVLALFDKATGLMLTAILAPTRMNYLGRSEGTFEVRLDTAAIGSLNPDEWDVVLARPRTRETWRLSRRQRL